MALTPTPPSPSSTERLRPSAPPEIPILVLYPLAKLLPVESVYLAPALWFCSNKLFSYNIYVAFLKQLPLDQFLKLFESYINFNRFILRWRRVILQNLLKMVTWPHYSILNILVCRFVLWTNQDIIRSKYCKLVLKIVWALSLKSSKHHFKELSNSNSTTGRRSRSWGPHSPSLNSRWGGTKGTVSQDTLKTLYVRFNCIASSPDLLVYGEMLPSIPSHYGISALRVFIPSHQGYCIDLVKEDTKMKW